MSTKTVTVFIPCLVDQCFPEMGIALVNVLRHLGHTVNYNPQVTCCGQPAFNAGHTKEAKSVAEHFISEIGTSYPIISISGSCTAMIRNFYKTLNLPNLQTELPNNIFELSEFLMHENLKGFHKTSRVAFHNSCHSLRELGISSQIHKLLENISGVEIINSPAENICCGFGGLFCVKFPDIANTMAKTRLDYFINAGAERIISNDPGCIMHLRKEAASRNIQIPIMHIVEFLAEVFSLPTDKFIEAAA